MPYKAAVISQQSESSKMTIKAMQKYFDKVDDLNIKHIEVNLGSSESEILYEGKLLQEYDCVYAKGSFRYSALLRAISSLLSERCFVPLSPSAFTNGHDKVVTHLKLQKENVPMPKTYLTSSPNAAKGILDKINYPIIMKFPQGTQGRGVMLADSKASTSSMMDALGALKQPFLIQEYVDTGGVDIRALVIGNEVVAAMKRQAKQGEQRANIHAGGSGEKVELDEETKKIAVDAANALDAGICGVDILESAKGPVVIEVNVSPGLQGITEVTKIDVADKIAKYLFDSTKEAKEAKKKIHEKDLFKKLGISHQSEIVTNLDFRGKRILLPELVTEITKFNEDEEVSVKADKKTLIIKGK